jgi:hypothetical protein
MNNHYIPPTIRQKTLKVHLEQLGVDWNLFCKIVDFGIETGLNFNYRDLSRRLTPAGKPSIRQITLEGWIQIRREDLGKV